LHSAPVGDLLPPSTAASPSSTLHSGRSRMGATAARHPAQSGVVNSSHPAAANGTLTQEIWSGVMGSR
jgi:hypothetical protein